MNTKFGLEFCVARNKEGWTLRQLEKKMQCTAAYISDIERGKRLPFSLKLINNLAAVNWLGKSREFWAHLALEHRVRLLAEEYGFDFVELVLETQEEKTHV